MSEKLEKNNHTILALEDMENDEPNEESKLTVDKQQEKAAVSKKPKIPDGGWGWMIVLASLIISLIQDGISFSFGTLYTEFVEEFKASKSSTAWIGSLFLSVPLLTGPLMSVLVDKYGCRSMTILAGLISASGFILSYFAKSILVMYITFGVISGMGLGLTYITAVVSIAFWFDKKRNLAVGLGACGTGIGTFVYAPFTTYLLEEFQWRWTVILLGGTLLNMCVCGALMRDPDWIIEQDRQNKEQSKSTSKCSSMSNVSHSSQNKLDLEQIRQLLKNGQDAQYILQMVRKIEEDEESKKEHQSVLNLPTFIKQNETVPAEVLEHLQENKKLYRVILENYPSLLTCRSISEKGLNKLTEETITRIPVTLSLKLKKTEKPKTPLTHQNSLPLSQVNEPLMPEKKRKINEKPDTTGWLVKQFSSTNPHANYFKNMRFPRHSIHRGAILNKDKYRLRASSCPNIYRVSMTTLVKDDDDEQWYTKLMKPILLFDEFHFCLLSISTIILFAWFMTPYFYLVDHMIAAGHTKDRASYVLSTIGVANTLGMVILGWAGDQTWTNVPKTLGVCLILCGACSSAIYISTDYYIGLHIFGALYGIFLGSSFSFTPIMLVEMLPLESFTKAYGLQLLCEGLGHLGGPPFAALLADLTGTWSYSFHLAAFWIVISGVLVLAIPFTRNRRMFGSGFTEKEREILG